MLRFAPLAKLFALFLVLHALELQAQQVPAPGAFPVPLPAGLPVLPVEQQASMDRDLMEITIPFFNYMYFS